MSFKNYCRNVILVMSGGVGARFGADCPKQYCTFKNRMVIDYVIDACRGSKLADAIVVVAAADYVDFVAGRYGLETVEGGATRPMSVANGLRYVHDHYGCDKLIITNAVCPLASSGQYDHYFRLLDEYDYVLTTWKLAPALHRFDGERVDRDEYFNVMEPDAYRFQKLYQNFDFASLKKYIFHNMPEDSKAYYCFDYPYTMKLTHSHDLKLLKVLHEEIIENPEREKTFQTVNNYLSADGTAGIGGWILSVQEAMREMAHKYAITSYAVNSQTEANIVYEAQSNKYGDIVLKFTPSSFHFHKEYLYYKLSEPGIMAELADWDEEYNMLVLKMVKPGLQVKFNVENGELRAFFDRVNRCLIPAERLEGDGRVPDVMGEFEEYAEAAGRFTFELEFRKALEAKARQVWEAYFEDAPKYYLHRDLHKRNILTSRESGVLAIDPRGALGPRAFEYVIPFIIELRDAPLDGEKYEEMFRFFSQYTGREDLLAALYIFWVYKMNDYVFQKNDGNRLAGWCKQCILDIYYGGRGDPGRAPAGLSRVR